MAAHKVFVAKFPFHLFHALIADNIFLLGMEHQIAVIGFNVSNGFQRHLIFAGIVGNHQRGGIFFLAALHEFVHF